MDNGFDLQRFIDAQDPVYAQVCAELRAGRKTSHWMWFIFPQIAGLGHSPMAKRYAIISGAEASAYAAHPILGQRLRACTGLVIAVEGRTLHDILGSPDDLKFHSCMTLFAQCAADPALFDAALRKFCRSQPDPQTMALL